MNHREGQVNEAKEILKIAKRINRKSCVVQLVKDMTDERGLLTYWKLQPIALDAVNVIRPRTFGLTFRYFGSH